LPRAPLRVGQIKGIVSVPVPGRTKTLVACVVTVAAVAVIAPMLSDSKAGDMSLAFVYASIMLSLVLLTGYGGYLNLAPLAFAGLGALIVGKLSTTSPYQFVVAAAVTGAIGAALGLLAIRLGTLYLAIATLAFAELVDYVIFNANIGFKGGGEIVIHRVSLFGLGVSSEQRFAIFAAVIFVLLGMLVLAIRRGRYGRLLIALRDSPAACGTLGLNLTLTRVTVFAVSSAMAGFAGALYANQAVSFGEVNFTFILNLFVVLGVVVGGVTSVSGALLGGFILTALFRGPQWLKTYSGVLIGISAMLLGRNPNGLVSYAFKLGRWAQAAVSRQSGAASHGSAAEDRSDVRGREEVVLGGSV
jgi:branched-chain amino acid transport system permease protein